MSDDAARIRTLKSEIDGDPLGRGYIGMSAVQVADDLNTEYRSVDRQTLSGRELLDATDEGELTTLAVGSPPKFQLWQALIQMDSISYTGANTRAIIGALFGSGTTTRANLVALRSKSVSRAEEIGLGKVAVGSVERARAL